MYSFLVSILIGIGVVLPGVSGSAIAILVGIYDKVLTVLNDFSIKALKKIIILFPVIIGIMVILLAFAIYNIVKIGHLMCRCKLDYCKYCTNCKGNNWLS